MRRPALFPPLALLLLSAALLVSCAGTPPDIPPYEPGHWDGSPVVQTRFGVVRGEEDSDQTWVWKAIPFAQPPVGELRWRAPRDPAPWAGVRAQGSFNGGCTQYSPVVRGSVHGSEDCLYLNVWRPRTGDTGLPVYVWIHGGGNSIGSSTMVPDYYGNRLASLSRMVFVSVNYRLGPFGWFTHPALRDGASAEDASGNYGTLDIIQSLKWIRDNIEAFGGDPRCVTISGESAGAFDVLSMMISPPARGLFHRAISQSGYARTHAVDEADGKADATLRQLIVADGKARSLDDAGLAAARMSPAEVRAYLRSKSDRQIMRCYGSWMMGMTDNADLIRDGVVLPSAGFDVLSTGEYPGKVPLIVGTNKEEVKLFQFFSGVIPWRSELYAAAAKYSSELWKADSVDEISRRLASRPDQPPVYAYQFAWGSPDVSGKSPMPGNWGRRLGAFHSLEIPFFLGTDTVNGVMQVLLFSGRNAPGRKALSAAIMDYTTRFARTGDPNRPGSGLPAWDPWTPGAGAPKYLVLDATSEEPVIAMSTVELTTDGVRASVETDLPEPLRTQVREHLEKSTMPSGVR